MKCALRIVVFVIYIAIVGCVVFEVFKLPWYNAIDKSLQRTHHLQQPIQKSCMVTATMIAIACSIVVSSIVYYIFLRNASQEKRVQE